MITNLLYDKICAIAIALAIPIGLFGFKKLKELKSKRITVSMTDEQSDQLVLGVFQVLMSAICLFCLL